MLGSVPAQRNGQSARPTALGAALAYCGPAPPCEEERPRTDSAMGSSASLHDVPGAAEECGMDDGASPGGKAPAREAVEAAEEEALFGRQGVKGARDYAGMVLYHLRDSRSDPEPVLSGPMKLCPELFQ
jgi:hypothetical protein